LKSVDKKISDTKTTKVNYGAMAQSYEPEGEMIGEKRKLSRMAQKMIDLENKRGENIQIPDKLKNKLNKNNPLTPPVDGV
jgi:hypothetical protein